MMSQTSTTSDRGNDDSAHLPDANVRTRRCLLCGGKGHGQFTCTKMLAYGASSDKSRRTTTTC